jgi:Rad3-related DNA helicase
MDLFNAIPPSKPAPQKPSKTSTSRERLSGDAFTAGMKILAVEYNREPDQDLMRTWWRQMKHLTDDEFVKAIDAYMLGPSAFHPHPGQIITLADDAIFDTRQELRDEARRQESTAQQDSVAHGWAERVRAEQDMAGQISTHLVKNLELSRKDSADQRLIAATIKHIMRCSCGEKLADQHGLCKTAQGLAGPGRSGQLEEALDAAQHIRAGIE